MATIRKLRGKWQAAVRRKGVPPRSKSFEKRAEAERWARELEGQIDRRGFMPDTRIAEQTTLGELLARYIEEVSPRKRSATSEITRVKAIMRRRIAQYSLAMLSSADLATYRDERLKSVAPATIVRELNTISHAIDIGRKEWGIYLLENPVKLVRRPALPRGRARRLQGDEEARLYAACDALRSAYMRPLITLSIETAMRRGELLGLLWGDIDWDRRIAHLSMTKNGDRRDVPLSPRAFETLETMRQVAESDRVFSASGNAVRLAWERVRRHAGCPDLHFHDLRHEAVSRLFEKGLDVMSVATISGHRELRMLQRYTHLRAEDLVARL